MTIKQEGFAPLTRYEPADFTPVTITLQSRGEVKDLHDALAYGGMRSLTTRLIRDALEVAYDKAPGRIT